MSGNTFGHIFKITTWGESHGNAIGVVIDGCPPQIPVTPSDIQAMLDRRKPGGSIASTSRKEKDAAVILSGTFENKTTGTPLLIMVENRDANSNAYQPYADVYRPGHADITYMAKYGIRDWRGGGRASARETVGRVAAGAVARLILNQAGIDVFAFTRSLGKINCTNFDRSVIEKNMFFAPDSTAAGLMQQEVAEVKRDGDSIGGIVEIRALGVPAGLGEPVFDKLDADLAKALMSIGAVKGVEIGAGFHTASMRGSQNNDPIMPGDVFSSNNAGGILGGISNGDEIIIRAAVKPIPSIGIEQNTIDTAGNPTKITIRGRHDVSAIPRINVVCESMVCLVLADHLLRQNAIRLERQSQ